MPKVERFEWADADLQQFGNHNLRHKAEQAQRRHARKASVLDSRVITRADIPEGSLLSDQTLALIDAGKLTRVIEHLKKPQKSKKKDRVDRARQRLMDRMHEYGVNLGLRTDEQVHLLPPRK